MKHVKLLLIIVLTTIVGLGELSAQISSITPAITHIMNYEECDGEFGFQIFDANKELHLYISADAETSQRLRDAVVTAGLKTKEVKKPAKKNYLNLIIDPTAVKEAEGYFMVTTANGINIQAHSGAGLFYALQTIRQMMEGKEGGKWATGEIYDYPRFEYRGIMIDISRHFRTVEFLKRQIDMMARLKMNRLHLHLTDAAGWRIEIDTYPRLTEYAAWRKPATWKEWWYGNRGYVEMGSEGAYGGYLTKEDAKELVRYAADRYITIIPEIEMPGHSEEVIAAYPELACTHKPEHQEDLCIGKEATFEMMQAILDEIIEIFPSEYIHIGGDEATKKSWVECEDCQRRMHEEGLESVDELQSYMIHRIEEYLNARGRQIIGWDEILQGGLAPNATVMSWRGEEGGRAAAAAGHKVIMSPHAYCYIDAPQDAPPTQPEAIGGYLPLEKVYSYDPTPKDMSEEVAQYILGVQGNLWAEFIPTDEHYEMMLWPRAIAIAEVGWSQPQEKEYDIFRNRAIDIVERMMTEGYHPFDLKHEIGERQESLQPIEHLARGKSVEYNYPSYYYGPQYAAAGDGALTDGMRGTWTYADGRWQGFLGRGGVDVTIDMGEVTHIESISADFMQYCGPGVFLPCLVEIAISEDGEHYTKIADMEHEVVVEDVPSFKNFGWSGSAEARYIRYKAHRSKYSGFLFVDEIVVK